MPVASAPRVDRRRRRSAARSRPPPPRRRSRAGGETPGAGACSRWPIAAPSGSRLSLVLPPERAIWILAFLPVWILVAKLAGLYDADHRAMRHLTVDEAPAIIAWGAIGTVAVGLLGGLTPAGTLDVGEVAATRGGYDRRRLLLRVGGPGRLAGHHAAGAGPDRRQRRPRSRDEAQARCSSATCTWRRSSRATTRAASTAWCWRTSGSTPARSP